MVYGLTRTPQRAIRLARHEIKPVVGSLQNPDSFLHLAAESDVVVHAAIDYESDSAALDTITVERLLERLSASLTPKALLYTSGVWVYGNQDARPVQEQSSLNPPQVVAWRPAVEQMVLNARKVRGIVIRPGVVYGKTGGLTGSWFEAAASGEHLRVIGDGYNRWAMVHVEDLTQGYVQAAAWSRSNEIFNLVGPAQDTVIEMVSEIARINRKIRQIDFIPLTQALDEIGPLAEALALNQLVDAKKARRLLNWQPHHQSFRTEVDTYYWAWQAAAGHV